MRLFSHWIGLCFFLVYPVDRSAPEMIKSVHLNLRLQHQWSEELKSEELSGVAGVVVLQGNPIARTTIHCRNTKHPYGLFLSHKSDFRWISKVWRRLPPALLL